MSNRLLYIDKLKALAMLLVVLGHTVYFCIYHEELPDDVIFGIVCTFHVPLFFFLSGFVVTESPGWRKFLRKAWRLMLPMVAVGLVNAVVIGRVAGFFLESTHNGYWYLLTLTIFYFFLMPFRLVGKAKGWKGFLADGILAIAVWCLFTLFTRSDGQLASLLYARGAWAFWPFFAVGCLCRKYGLARYVIGKPWLSALLTLAYVTLVIVHFPALNHLPRPVRFAAALIAIAALLGIFHRISNSNTFIDRELLLIGNSTLSIYVVHYFFIRFIDLEFLAYSSFCRLILSGK